MTPLHGRLVDDRAPSDVLGETIACTVYLPPGYGTSGATRYPTAYLLHGRGDSRADWVRALTDLDDLVAASSVPPLVAVVPDAPWSCRGSYYVDSSYAGGSPGAAVETAFTRDLLAHVDRAYRTIAAREARLVGGYSMGGAGALRHVTAHPELYAAALILSPAVYVPSPPPGSSARVLGAFGNGAIVFDEDRYAELSYPTTFARFDPRLSVRLFVAVGDDEPVDASRSLTDEARALARAAASVPGLTCTLRAYHGGHDWGTWSRAFREGLVEISDGLPAESPQQRPGVR